MGGGMTCRLGEGAGWRGGDELEDVRGRGGGGRVEVEKVRGRGEGGGSVIEGYEAGDGERVQI